MLPIATNRQTFADCRQRFLSIGIFFPVSCFCSALTHCFYFCWCWLVTALCNVAQYFSTYFIGAMFSLLRLLFIVFFSTTVVNIFVVVQCRTFANDITSRYHNFEAASNGIIATSSSLPAENSFFTFHHPWFVCCCLFILVLIFIVLLFCAVRFYYVKRLIKVTEWERRVLMVVVGRQNPKFHQQCSISNSV